MIRLNEKTESLSKNKLAFAAELARGVSVAQAAKLVGVSEPTGYRWARSPEVAGAIAELRSALFQEMSSRMASIACKAIQTVEKLLSSDCERTRLAAARTVIDGTMKMRQSVEIEQELEGIHRLVLNLPNQSSTPGRGHV